MAHDPSDPEIALRPRQAPDLTGTLFQPWPEAPAAGTEQEELPLGGTLTARYHAWRRTAEGMAVWGFVAGRAVHLARTGAQRLSAKGLLELCRASLHVGADNRYTALLARECEATYPETRGLFETRRRTAA